MNLAKEYDVVEITASDHGIRYVVDGRIRVPPGTAFLVEFLRGDGGTVSVEELTVSDIRRLAANEIGHARRL